MDEKKANTERAYTIPGYCNKFESIYTRAEPWLLPNPAANTCYDCNKFDKERGICVIYEHF